MNRFELAKFLVKSTPINKETFIENLCKNKVVLDLGCVRHTAEYALNDPNWLHKKIKNIAKEVVGIDYLAPEIKKLNEHGYDIQCFDVTKPMTLNKKFEVIIAGDLIEHLVNFEWFFNNCTELLEKDGILVITTANPFYVGQFFYTNFKNNYIVNPEHTCWIDPQCLSQLATRFDFEIKKAFFISTHWKLGELILENEKNKYNVLTGKWQDSSFSNKLKRKFISLLFRGVFSVYKALVIRTSRLSMYSDYLAILK